MGFTYVKFTSNRTSWTSQTARRTFIVWKGSPSPRVRPRRQMALGMEVVVVCSLRRFGGCTFTGSVTVEGEGGIRRDVT